jgi:hypothetical protein
MLRQYAKMKRLFFLISLIFISLGGFSQSRSASMTTKKIVFARDGGVCQCCGSSQVLEFDHIIPFSCGGNAVVSNIQLLCQKCNRSKSNSCYCKVHNKKVGRNCCAGKTTRSNSIQTLSKKYSNTSTQCKGTTQKGSRCKNKTRNSNGRCHLH